MTLTTTRIPGSAEESRAAAAAVAALPDAIPPLDPAADRTPLVEAPGGVGGEWVTARGADLPGAVIYLHGGGFQQRIPELAALLGHEVPAAARRPAFAAHYRLAPAHPYPAAVEDVPAIYRGLRDAANDTIPASCTIVLYVRTGGAV